ncbi:MAG TPA: hypothetical protein VGK45_16380, partial [Thermoanaerobaculia bacterium]
KKPNLAILASLQKLGFYVAPPLGSKFDTTNAIWYGQGIQAEDLRVVSLTLTELGIKVQLVASYQDPAAHENIITIGTATGALTLPVLAVDQLRTLGLTPARPLPARASPPAAD